MVLKKKILVILDCYLCTFVHVYTPYMYIMYHDMVLSK